MRIIPLCILKYYEDKYFAHFKHIVKIDFLSIFNKFDLKFSRSIISL